MKESVTVHVAAPPDEVWALVSDVTQIGRYSPETMEAEWLDDAVGPAVGARFRGHVRRNEWGPTYWSVCEVTECEPGAVFAFDVLGPDGSRMNHWRYDLRAAQGGTELTETMELPQRLLLDVYARTLGVRRARYNRRNIATTLGRIKATIEGTEPPPQTARDLSRDLVVSDEVVVAAAPLDVWQLVADPTRIREFSPENVGATTPSTGPLEVGETFVGHNRRGPATWSTTCEVTASDPGERFAFRVRRWGTPAYRFPVRIASWEFTFEPVDGGTRVTETWRDDRRWPDAAADRFDRVATGGRTFAEFQRRNIRRSLDRLAELAETGLDPASR